MSHANNLAKKNMYVQTGNDHSTQTYKHIYMTSYIQGLKIYLVCLDKISVLQQFEHSSNSLFCFHPF